MIENHLTQLTMLARHDTIEISQFVTSQNCLFSFLKLILQCLKLFASFE